MTIDFSLMLGLEDDPTPREHGEQKQVASAAYVSLHYALTDVRSKHRLGQVHFFLLIIPKMQCVTFYRGKNSTVGVNLLLTSFNHWVPII